MGAYSFRYWSNEAGGTTIVLIHGFTGNGASWREVAGRIGTGRKVVSVDLPGHDGATPHSDEQGGFEGAVDRLARAIRKARLRGCHVAGYSLGGRVALGLIVRHPDLVRGGTLIGAGAGLRTKAERKERAAFDAKWIEVLENEGIEEFVRRWEELPVFSTQKKLDPAVLEAQRATRLAHSPAALAASLRALGQAVMPNYWPVLDTIELPVHLVAGAKDKKYAAVATMMAGRLKQAHVTMIPGAGHNVVLEAPGLLAKAILEHCDDKKRKR